MAILKNVNLAENTTVNLPKGTQSERPVSPEEGYIRYNTTLDKVEYYKNGAWRFSPDIIKDDLVVYLDAGNLDSYSGSGSTWFDLSGSNINGSISGASHSFFQKGCFDFDGVNDVITLSTSVNFSAEQTLIMGLRPEESDGNRRNPYNQAYGGYGTITHEPGGNLNYFYGINGGNGSPYQGVGSDNLSVGENEDAIISVSRSQDKVKWYKNGKLYTFRNTSYSNASNSNNTILIGDGYTNPFLGKIYFLLLYTRALSGSEIRQNFNFFRDRYNL